MTMALWLRIASLISLLFAAGHTLGGRKAWSPLGETETLTAMRTRFEVFGVERSYLDFYLGFGFTISVLMLLQTVVLWQLAGLARSSVAQVRPIVIAFAVASLGCTLLAWRFIFPVPTIFGAVLTATLFVAAALGR